MINQWNIFLWDYANGKFGWRLWDPFKHKIARSKYVIFNESYMYKRSKDDMEVKKFVGRFAE